MPDDDLEVSVTETPAAAAPPPPPPNPGPWAADLTEYFGDNQEAIAAADRYMREKVQPRMTQLEEGTKDARELYDDLLSEPDSTIVSVVSEIYGEETAAKFAALFGENGQAAPAGTTVEAAVAQAAAASPDDIPAWAKPIVEDHQARKQREADESAREAGNAAYQEVLAEVRAAHPDVTDADIDLIHPFMAAAGGDPEAAYAGLQAYKQHMAASLGIQPPDAEEKVTLPPVLPGGGTAPPTQKKYRDVGEAIDDWFSERRTAAPPPVI